MTSNDVIKKNFKGGTFYGTKIPFRRFAKLHRLIGQCLCGLKQLAKALLHFINSRKIYLSDCMEMKCYPIDLADVVYLKVNCLVCLQRESDVLNCFEQAIGHYNDRPRENMSVVKIYMGDDQGLMIRDAATACQKRAKLFSKTSP